VARSLAYLASIAIVLVAGYVQGARVGRWSQSKDLTDALARIDRVAMDVGDWRGKPFEFDANQLKQAEILGHLARRYENARDGSALTVLLVCGRPGPISVHTPDVCYAGIGYEPSADPASVAIPGEGGGEGRDAFTVTDFRKTAAANPAPLRIFWSWSNGGPWRTPDNPRLTFAPSPYLFKMYVIRDGVAAGMKPENDPAVAFLKAMLPELRKSLLADYAPAH